MWVRLQGFNYRINYVPGKKAGSENNEADYNSRHPEPLARQEGRTSSKQADFELRETEGEFGKDIMAIVKLSGSSYMAGLARGNACRQRAIESE